MIMSELIAEKIEESKALPKWDRVSIDGIEAVFYKGVHVFCISWDLNGRFHLAHSCENDGENDGGEFEYDDIHELIIKMAELCDVHVLLPYAEMVYKKLSSENTWRDIRYAVENPYLMMMLEAPYDEDPADRVIESLSLMILNAESWIEAVKPYRGTHAKELEKNGNND